ncbi:extracellular solute-binding protein [Pontibacillus yanchengensis]|uniref:Extracellular solute-binding protein n=1 Tax=Pontibacillus yanchengensis TaxID=462910 RepID=A0A6I5A3R9_9BACI|nr:extracellular solute-binding protein [Pontibacillus yanchengensis]MYL34671.1 extracellular solute-binding protein [Pontibacillus yanchengensis]
MKKWFMFLLTLSFAASILVACGGDGAEDSGQSTDEGTEEETDNTSEDKNESANDSSGETTTIKFAAQNDNTPATKMAIEEFNNSQEKYKVEWVQMTNDSQQMHDQLLTSLSSGSGEYDVLSMDVVWAGEFAGAGYLETIDMKMDEAGLEYDNFNSGSMTAGNYKAKQYTLPFFPDLGLMYFRKDIVSEEDAKTLQSGDYSYDDLAKMAEQYAGKNETKTGFVYQSKQYEGLTVNVTEFTNQFENTKQGLDKMYEFTEASWTPDDILNYTEGETHTAFENGNAVFARNWPYMFGRLKNPEDSGAKVKMENVGIAPLPNGGSVGGWLLGINANSEKKEGAWEFIQFMAGPEGQKIMSTEGGYLPGYNPLLEDEDVLNSNELLTLDPFQKALKSTISRPVSPDYAKVSDTIQVSTHKYLSSGEGLEDAVNKIEGAVED